MLAHKIEKRIVESKEAILICDKCGVVVKTNPFSFLFCAVVK